MREISYKKNIVANLIGRALTAALAFATVPIVIHLIGVESYGLIGIFATLQAIFGLLDLGLSSTMTREMARRSASDTERDTCRDFVRTIEIFYWAIGVLVGVLTIALAPFVAHRWIHVQVLTTARAENAVVYMGITLAAQWPLSLYEGGIMGLQRQALWNAVSLSMTVLRTAAALIVLFLVSQSVEAYLLAQAAGYGLQTIVTAGVLWSSLPAAAAPIRIRPALLKGVWRFAAGISATSIVGVMLTQIDKVVLSKLLDLRAFGYYAVAATAAAGIYYIVGPIFTAVYPQLTQRVAEGGTGLGEFYHRASQLLAAILFPVACTLAFFSHDVLLLWTRDAETATAAATVLTILVAGTALHGIMHIPYALQLAYGWTTLTLTMNSVMVLLLGPLMYGIARRFGAPGAAFVWFILNCAYVCVVVPLMHRRLLKPEMARWYLHDVLTPLVAAIATVAVWRIALPPNMLPVAAATALCGCLLTAFGLTLLATPTTREQLLAYGGRFALKVRTR